MTFCNRCWDASADDEQHGCFNATAQDNGATGILTLPRLIQLQLCYCCSGVRKPFSDRARMVVQTITPTSEMSIHGHRGEWKPEDYDDYADRFNSMMRCRGWRHAIKLYSYLQGIDLLLISEGREKKR